MHNENRINKKLWDFAFQKGIEEACYHIASTSILSIIFAISKSTDSVALTPWN